MNVLSDSLRRMPAAATLVTTAPALSVTGDGRVTNFLLDNGMEVVVIPFRRAPIVTHMVWYKIGSADEPPCKSGLAHFVEHLMFKGATTNHAAGELGRAVAAIGGSLNAFTWYDFTAYRETVAPSALEQMMRFEADRMVNLILTDDDIRTERDVIIEERRLGVDNNPQSMLEEQVHATLWQNQPYRIPIIGWMQEIEKLNRTDAIAFYDKYYTPGNAVLVVAGDVDPETVKELATKTYGKLAVGPALPPRTRPAEPEQNSRRTVTLSDARVSVFSFSTHWVVPSYRTAEPGGAEALELLAEILGGGNRSRLYQQLVKGGIAAKAGAYFQGATLDETRLNIYGSPRGDAKLADLEATAHAVIASIVKDGVTDNELEKAKSRCVRSQIFDRDKQDHAANLFGSTLAVGGTVQDIEEWPDRIRKVTAAQVKAAAARFLAPDRSTTGYLLPDAEFDVTTHRCGVLAQARSPWRREGSAPSRAVGDPSARDLVPHLAGAKRLNIQHVKSEKGIDAWLVEDHTRPITAIHFVFDGGTTQDPAGKQGLANLMSALLVEGAGDLDSDAFQVKLDDVGAELSFQAQPDGIHGSMRMLSEQQEAAFDLLRIAVNRPRFDPEPMDRIHAQVLSDIIANERYPEAIAERKWQRSIYGTHPYSRPTEGTKESLAGITPADLNSFRKATFALDGLHVAVVGDIDAKRLCKKLTQLFGDLPQKQTLAPVPDVDPRLGQQVEVDYDLPQTSLRLAYPAVKRSAPDFYAVELLNEILGGSPITSRLWREVRERGLTYVACSSLVDRRHSNALEVRTATRSDRAAGTLNLMREVVKKMAEDGPTEAELEASKKHLIGAYAIRKLDSSTRIAARLVEWQLDKLGIDSIQHRAALIDQVTLEQVKAAAKKLLSGDPAIMVVGPPIGGEG